MMKIVKIKSGSNGFHDNRMGNISYIPDGWAVIPDCIAIPDTFPFVDIEAAEIDGAMTVTSMTARVVPEPVPDPEPTQLDRVEAQATYTAMMTDTLLEG